MAPGPLITLPALQGNPLPGTSVVQDYILEHIELFTFLWWSVFAAVSIVVLGRLVFAWWHSL